MNEEEYFIMQELLTKYRVFCMKQFGDVSNPKRHSYVLQIRHIDYLRNKIELCVGKEEEDDERQS